MGKLNKKQIPQVILLAMLAVGLFGRFAYCMLKPTPAAARTQVATTTVPAATVHGTGFALAALDPTAPPPTPGMRDPFVPGMADELALEAYQKSLHTSSQVAPQHQKSMQWNRVVEPPVPYVPPLPGGNSDPASDGRTLSALPVGRPTELPATPAAPQWTVTGVLDGDNGQMAILRNGDARRIVHEGDMVDDGFRVVSVTRGHVTLGHGRETYSLPLGGAKIAPAAPAAPSSVAPPAYSGPNSPQDLGAPSQPVTGLPAGTVTPGGTQIDPNALIKLPGGFKLPTINMPAQ